MGDMSQRAGGLEGVSGAGPGTSAEMNAYLELRLKVAGEVRQKYADMLPPDNDKTRNEREAMVNKLVDSELKKRGIERPQS